jgi:hypothetical protein
VKKALRILAIGYISYLALVLLVITPALNLAPPWLVKKYLGREFHSEIIWFNPFTLSLELRRTELPEHDGTPFVSLDRARVDLSLSSLWSRALVFDEVSVDKFYVHVIENPDGSFNFSDMIPPEKTETPPAEPAGIPAVTIQQLNFNAQQLVFTSLAREKPSSTNLSNIAVNIEGLSTVVEEGRPYTLDALGENGGELHWKGEVSIPRSYSEGTLALTNIQLNPFWQFAQEWLAFQLPQGTASVEGRYRVDWSKGLDYRVEQGEVRLDGIVLQPKAPGELPDTSIALGSLKLAGIELDGPAQHVDIGSLAVAQLAVSGWSEGTEVSLARLFAVDLPQDPAPQPPPSSADTGASGKGWSAALGSFELADSSLRWRSEYTDPAQLEISPLEVSANDIKWPLEGDTGLKSNLVVNGQATAAIEGKLDLAQGTGSLSYQLAALPLAWFNPNFPAALNVEITDGQLQVAGDLTLAQYAPATIAMNGAIKGFAGKITDAEESLTAWETVRWDKLLVDMDQHSVELAKLSIDNYSGRIHINKDGSINAQNVWKQEVGAQVEEVKDDLAEGKPWVVSVPLIRITDSEIDFKDESLPIHFGTVIGDIDGNIKNISTRPGSKTRVDIKGSVDGYAPVTLAGTAEPLRDPLALDLELIFAGVDMALLSPYSGTYAGYAIERGVLNLDLKYAMEDNHLKGNNKIVINQMKLGEKIASDKAVDLPLELALALLTDSKGVIDMEIPVGGNVDDPQFNVGSVVIGALVNLITKAITSPFTLLASLVDSEEDLQRLNFKSGSAALLPSTKAKLDNLSAALAQRPELNLVITGRLQLQADRERLQKNILQAELVAAGLPEEELSSKGPAWEEAIAARYQALVPGETELSSREQYQKLAQEVPLPDSDLLTLATERAVAVKTYLVTEAGLDPARAAIAKSDLGAGNNLYSGAELEIDI